MANEAVRSGVGQDQARIVTSADLGCGCCSNAPTQIRIPSARLAEENLAGWVGKVFRERNASDAFVKVRFNAFVICADDEGVGDFEGGGAVPALKIRDAAGHEATGVGEADVTGRVVRAELGNDGLEKHFGEVAGDK